MTALEVVRILQAMGWVHKDEGDHAPNKIIPVLVQFLSENQFGCPVCNGEIPPPATAPKKRGRPKKT